MNFLSTEKLLIFTVILFIFIFGFYQTKKTNELTVSEALNQGERLVGEEIQVRGKASTETVMCTMMACRGDNPCCNSCSGNLALEGNGSLTLQGSYKNRSVGCSGTNCNMTCWPLEKGKEYLVNGILKKSRSNYFLQLKNFSRIKNG